MYGFSGYSDAPYAGSAGAATPQHNITASLPAITAVITTEGIFEVRIEPRLPEISAVITVAKQFTPVQHYPKGKREFTADFNKGTRSSNLSTTKRPDALTFDYLRAFTLGPKDIADLSGGIIDRPWYARADNDNKTVFVSRANDDNTAWLPETVLFTFTGVDIEELDFAFEQAARPVICAERKSGVAGAKEIWLYWFKPTLGAFTFEMIEAGRTPRLVLDNPPDITRSDVEFFYLKPATGLVVRTQREAYAVVHSTPHLEYDDWYLEDVFYTNNWRVAAILVHHSDAGQYGKKRLETTLMPVYLPAESLAQFLISIQSIADPTVKSFFTLPVESQVQFPLDIQSLADAVVLMRATLPDESDVKFTMSLQSMDDTVVLFRFTHKVESELKFEMALQSLADAVVRLFHTLAVESKITAAIDIQTIDDS